MGRIWDLLHKWRIHLLGGLLFVLSMVIVFGEVLWRYAALIAPDSMPYFAYAYRTGTVEGLLSGQSFTPHTLYWLVFDPLVAHELTYIIDTLVLVLAGVYYLRGRRLHPFASWCGGLALGLSGYTFTLFCAGHRGYFHMFSCAVWSFGLLIRCFETRKLFYFAMLGLVLAWGVPYQPDVLFLVGLLISGYVFWLTTRNRRQNVGVSSQRPDEGGQSSCAGCCRAQAVAEDPVHSGILKTVIGVWPRFGVSVVVLVLAGFGGIRGALTTQVEGREEFFARVMKQNGQAAEPSKSTTEAEDQERWNFATSWSLPPEDVLEFIVPGVFGNESVQGAYPYWGRLGRPPDSQFQKGRMMPNYRQHTVCLGMVSVLLALFAVVTWLFGERARKESPSYQAAGYLPQASVYSDVPFWSAVWLVCLLLAFGRYTPLYRLFYAIPYMGYIRCPVKFVHLVEIATAFLAGFGMDVLLRTERQGVRRRLLWISVGMVCLLLTGLLVTVVARPSVVRHITELGMGQVAEVLSGYTLQNVARSAGLAALVAGLAYAVSSKAGERIRICACFGVVGVLVLDQALVARRYVKVMNVGALYSENAVVKEIKKQAEGQVASVVNYASPNTGQDWFSMALTFNGIRNLVPSQAERSLPYGLLFAGLQSNPVRLWQVLNAQFVIVPRKAIDGLLRLGVLQPVLDFELGQGVVRRTMQPGEKTLTLARVRGVVKAPRWIVDWQGSVPVDKQVESSVSGKQTVSDAPSPAVAMVADAAAVNVFATRGEPGVFATRVKVTAKSPGLLVFDERVAGNQEILVDGRRVPLYTVDGIWPAAVVPAGGHQVIFRQQRKPMVFLLGALTTLAVLVWGVSGALFKIRSRGAGAVA